MLIAWDDLEPMESLEEIREGFSCLDNKKLMETILAILVSEHDIDLREVVVKRKQLINISGDPIEYIDEHSGEIILDAE